MHIRCAKSIDSPQLVQLLNSSDDLKSMDTTRYDESYIIEEMNNPTNSIIVCEEGEKIVGALIAEVWTDKKYGYIEELIIDQDYRRKGIGTELFSYFEEVCKSKSIEQINCHVKVTNEGMQTWCMNKGFTKGRAFYFYSKNVEIPGLQKGAECAAPVEAASTAGMAADEQHALVEHIENTAEKVVPI
jgi:ribosomal protein S18 acetylase RimI-like enzyme